MDEIKIFENEEFGQVRTVTIGDEPWFVGKDVAEALGYSNTRKALIDHVDDMDKKDGVTIRDSMGRAQNPVCINESGLYALIFGSKLDSAKRFKHWVTSEVLPSIRKHGMYAKEELLDNPDMFISVLQELKAERERNKICQQTISIQNQQIAEMQPKVSYYDVVLNCKDLVAISTISKDYGWSATKMNEYLHEIGVQYRQGKIWLLYENYAKQGYTSTKTHTYNGNDGNVHIKPHTYWTPKGRLFLYNKLKENGIYPLIEQENKLFDASEKSEVRTISYRKQNYADLSKWRKTLTNYNRNYYRKTAKYPPRDWTDEEVELIMKREMSDRELSEMLVRSMKSIVLKRHRVKKNRKESEVV